MKTSKKLLLLLLPLVLISTSCSATTNQNDSKATSKDNLINCYYVEVTEKPNQNPIIFSAKYKCSYSFVCEYTNKKGDKIYTSYSTNNPLKVYENRYINKYEEYTFNKTIGLLANEQNIYLDIEYNAINIEIDYFEYSFDFLPDYIDGVDFDNAKAYECAKSGYYRTTTSEIIKDIDRHDLVDKESYKFNENYTIKYQEKWF